MKERVCRVYFFIMAIYTAAAADDENHNGRIPPRLLF